MNQEPEDNEKEIGILIEWREHVASILAEFGYDRILEWIQDVRKGTVTAREVLHGFRHRFSYVEEVQEALECLEYSGLGKWTWRVPGPKGGRPTLEFVVPLTHNETPRKLLRKRKKQTKKRKDFRRLFGKKSGQ